MLNYIFNKTLVYEFATEIMATFVLRLKIKASASTQYLLYLVVQDQVVRKPINVNPRVKINRSFHLAYFKCFQELI